MLDAGDPAEYIEYPTVGHNVWNAAYGDRAAFEWLAGQRRNPAPERVRFVTRSYAYRTAYWLHIDGLTPGALGSWTPASPASPKRAWRRAISTPSPSQRAPVRARLVTIDGTPIRVRAGGSLSFVKVDGHWKEGKPAPAAKAAGAEGPIAAAVSGAHLYVFGTADNPPPEVEAARRKAAESAADWSSPPHPRPQLKFAVKADSEVTDVDIQNFNLVLFGTRRTNSLIARFAADWPLALNSGAATTACYSSRR